MTLTRPSYLTKFGVLHFGTHAVSGVEYGQRSRYLSQAKILF